MIEAETRLDVRSALGSYPMRWPQVIVIAVTMALTGLDGFDVLAISFASPGIASEWHINRAALGVVMSMELVGMSVGSIALGRAADQIGRRPMMLTCLVMMATGMFMVTFARGIADLSAWRLLTGLGIGGMLATTNAVASEFSSDARRELGVSLMAIGYPLGATIGGTIGAVLLRNHGWRAVFYFGWAITALFIPIILFFVPESVQWLMTKQPRYALERVNRTLTRMGHPRAASLPDMSSSASGNAKSNIFSPELRAFTVLATIAYCFHVFTFYYILKWLPTIVVDMGFAPSSAAGVLVWTNLGGVAGALTFGLLSKKVGLKRLTLLLMIVSSVMIFVFGHASKDIGELSLISASAGFSITGGIVGLYGIFARGFPTGARASGTGFGIGVGRGGSVMAPIVAGVFFRNGYGVASVSAIMAIGSLISAAAVLAMSFPRTLSK